MISFFLVAVLWIPKSLTSVENGSVIWKTPARAEAIRSIASPEPPAISSARVRASSVAVARSWCLRESSPE